MVPIGSHWFAIASQNWFCNWRIPVWDAWDGWDGWAPGHLQAQPRLQEHDPPRRPADVAKLYIHTYYIYIYIYYTYILYIYIIHIYYTYILYIYIIHIYIYIYLYIIYISKYHGCHAPRMPGLWAWQRLDGAGLPKVCFFAQKKKTLTRQQGTVQPGSRARNMLNRVQVNLSEHIAVGFKAQ